jgi:hypothetical protein
LCHEIPNWGYIWALWASSCVLTLTGSMVQDDSKLSYDSGEVPKVNRVVGGSKPGCEIVSLHDKKLAKWSSASCVPKNKEEEEEEFYFNLNHQDLCSGRTNSQLH